MCAWCEYTNAVRRFNVCRIATGTELAAFAWHTFNVFVWSGYLCRMLGFNQRSRPFILDHITNHLIIIIEIIKS